MGERELYNMRGFWFMVEATFAGVILVTVVAFFVSSNIYVEEQDLTTKSYRILNGLYRQELLKQYAATGNYTAINNEVSAIGYGHSVQICTPEQCVGDPPNGSNVWAGSYISPGLGVYDPKEVKLYIFET